MPKDNKETSPNAKKAAQISTRQFAYFIVDGLINEKIVKSEDLEKAVEVVVDELNVRRAIGDYSFDSK